MLIVLMQHSSGCEALIVHRAILFMSIASRGFSSSVLYCSYITLLIRHKTIYIVWAVFMHITQCYCILIALMRKINIRRNIFSIRLIFAVTFFQSPTKAFRIFNTYVGDHMRTVVLGAIVNEMTKRQLLGQVKETGEVLLTGLQKLEVSSLSVYVYACVSLGNYTCTYTHTLTTGCVCAYLPSLNCVLAYRYRYYSSETIAKHCKSWCTWCATKMLVFSNQSDCQTALGFTTHQCTPVSYKGWWVVL